MGFQEEEERPRPAFAAKAPYLEKNPITGVREPSFPQSQRYKRIAAGSGLIILMVIIIEYQDIILCIFMHSWLILIL
jgi:anoctamin-7